MYCSSISDEITDYKRVCYYGSWEIYKTGIYKFTADSIPDLDLCTHYIYSFAGVDPKTKTIVPLDEVDEKTGYETLTDKKKINPDIKVILAIGGWTFSALPAFTELVKTDESMEEFCENAVKYLRKWKFDGVDMDWEYPGNRGSPPEDKHNYATLLERMRETFEAEAEETGNPRLLLSSAVPIGKSIVDSGFDRKRLGEAVDFLNIMVYDLYTIFSDNVGHHAGLYPRAGATGEDLQLNAEWGMGYWAEEVEKAKLILGLPTYSRTFTMNTTVNEPGDWDVSAGVAFSKVSVVRYYEICTKLQDGTWTEGWDDEQSVPFAFTDTEWSGYDNERSVQAKADFVKDNQYGGLMVWQLPADDFPGTSCGKGKYPIIDAMRKSLESSRGNFI
ncbi:hypothetical protein LOTGIDRAFT_110347 [Lottia gigantea]|uniref:GH18 domain-containing protein n=1 Tax=Lottia gigantea TaxID=225164 RepID=V4CN95_LOTGI|nr:hypothetical protein LOTGIDRAFT_110347 [Lottia gigantea]ESP03840.1 hypothetical protein LOTGIDRAFT_110347 [Lottia gigantea]